MTSIDTTCIPSTTVACPFPLQPDDAVTVAVGPLPPGKIDLALARGLDRARGMARRGLIVDACLALQGENRVLGGLLVSAA